MSLFVLGEILFYSSAVNAYVLFIYQSCIQIGTHHLFLVEMVVIGVFFFFFFFFFLGGGLQLAFPYFVLILVFDTMTEEAGYSQQWHCYLFLCLPHWSGYVCILNDTLFLVFGSV